MSRACKLLPLLAILATLFAFLAPASPAFADGLIVINEPPPNVRVPGHFSFAPLEVSYHKVDCTIDDQAAVTSVDQEFVNPNNARLEGTYIFPVPKDAIINNFAMDIDGKQVQAELLPAEKARGIYEEIVRKSKDPALLEYAGRAMFKVRIFPIEPYAKKRVTLKYTELLPQANNLLHYHYTLNTEKFSSKPLKNVSLKIAINSSQPLTNIYSPSHEVEVKRHGENKATVGYEAKDIRPDTDFHLYIGRKAAPVGISVLTYKPDADKDGYFVVLAAPTLSAAVKPMAKDVVFVMDTSGSMSGPKIEQARKSLKFCINSLNKDDRFDIVRFSTEAEPFFKEIKPASDENKKKAIEFTDGLKATGGTAIQDALDAALNEVRGMQLLEDHRGPAPLPIIVFLTDGQPTVGEQNPDRILAKTKDATKGVRIFTFGVGTDVNTKLLDQMAEQSKGYAQYVLPNEDIEVAMSNFFSKVQDPVIAGLKLQFVSNKANDVDRGSPLAFVSKLYPKELPDLFKGDQLVAFGTYNFSGPGGVILTGTVNGKEEKFAQDVSFPDKTDGKNDWIGKLWATRRVGYLLDEIRLHGESKELKDEVTELARKFGIVTPYTAMLIIEDERNRSVPVASRTLGDMERDSGAMHAAKAGFDSLARKDEAGKQAVANSVNNEEYKHAKSLEGAQVAAEQKKERLNYSDDSIAALGRRAPVAEPRRVDGAMGAGAAGNLSGWAAAPAAPASSPVAVQATGSTFNLQPTGEKTQQAQGYKVVTNYAQQNRMINDRAFYLNGNQWTDARVQKLEAEKKATKRVTIKFGSDEYFQLLKDNPDAAQWMALGNNVTFEIKGVIYDIVEDTKATNQNNEAK